jgi:putative CocE/NonD family hydrolase
VVVGPWTHGADFTVTRVGAREMGPAASVDYDALVLRWMDRWVRGLDNGIDREPPVRVYAMGAGAWRTAEAWPPPAERRPLYLSGMAQPGRRAGALTWAAPGADTQVSFVSDPADPVGDPHHGEAGGLDYRALSTRADVVTFETAPLDDDVEVVGAIEAHVAISVDRPDTDLWVKLLDVQPDGTAFGVMSIGLDVLRASYRHRRPGRELLQPGRVYPLVLDTLMTANRFRRGHRLRVAIMASFAPNLSRNLHTGRLESESADGVAATVTVHAGPAWPSRLVLPVARDHAR